MKNTLLKAVLLALFLVTPMYMASAETLSGTQTSGSAGSNAKLQCTAITISKPMTISAVSGNNAGFWVVKGNTTVAQYYKPNDTSAIGTTLQPGTYTVYPNLPKGSSSASVTLTLK